MTRTTAARNAIAGIAAIAALATLTGCDVLFPEDPRIGPESEAQCAARVQAAMAIEWSDVAEDGDAIWVPIYTFDITKLSLEAIQALSAGAGDETQGTRLDRTTNETSTAVDRFMAQSVDENGAFFLGRDPALYRVRGEPQRFADVITAGCARQQENMRLIDVDLAPPLAARAPELIESPDGEPNPFFETER